MIKSEAFLVDVSIGHRLLFLRLFVGVLSLVLVLLYNVLCPLFLVLQLSRWLLDLYCLLGVMLL